jgi:hypothetical protein
MKDVKIATSTLAHEKQPSSIPGPSHLSDDHEKRIYNSATAEKRNPVLEDGVNGANEKHRPVVDIQEYFVRVKNRRNETALIFADRAARY